MSETTPVALAEIFTPPLPGEWGSEPRGQKDTLVLRAADFTKDCKLRAEIGVPRFVPPGRLANRVLKNGYILVEASGGSPDQPAGRVARFNRENESCVYSYSNFLQLLKTTADFDSLFSYYLLVFRYSAGKVLRYQQQTTGIINFKLEQYLKEQVAVPRLSTQQKIARILQAVDRAMEKTEALIEKYQQIKTGLMHDLFTRGLWTQEELDNGDHQSTLASTTAKFGQLRPTRQDAPDLYQETPIGWIPKAWGMKLLGSIVNPQRPIVYGILMPGTGFPGGVPVVKVKDINHRRIDIDNLLLTSPAIDREYRRSRLKGMDVLMTIRGTVGRICIVPNELEGANITQDTARIDIVDGNSRFFSFFFETEAAVKHFDVNTIGQAVKGINLGEVRKTPVVLPRRAEQDEIAHRIDSAHHKLEKETLALAKLQKQKAGLLHDLLTGEVSVTPAPDEASDV